MANPFSGWSQTQADAHNARVIAMKGKLKPAEKTVSATKLPKPRKSSVLENRFDIIWTQLGGPALEGEKRFHPVRKWRFDRAITGLKIAVELEGGTFSGGRHTRGAGYAADCEKYNTAQMLGWIVFRLTSANPEKIKELVEFVKTKSSTSNQTT